MARLCIFLVAAALIVGMVGCGSGQYSLTIHCTEGGWLEGSGSGTFNYDYGTVVDLIALPSTCYEFVNWTGDVGTIADVEISTTTITMYGSYVITANFAPKVTENLEIWDWYDLDAVRDNMCWNYTLMNDLDSTTAGYEELAGPTANGGKGWQPIGYFSGQWGFGGTFDGQGYEIRDLFINRPGAKYVGLFDVVGEGGVIKNISVVNATVTGNDQVGAMVGLLAGYIHGWSKGGSLSNCYSSGNITGISMVGGLVGYSYGTVSNSYSASNMTGTRYVGGLVGFGDGTVSNSYSTGSVNGYSDVGGLVGRNRGTVSDSYATGSVNGNEDVGGLTGHNDYGSVSSSFWDIETSGQSTSEGGTGKNTTEMQDITTFSGAGWNITAVAPNETNPAYIWNIVNNVTYPFLSWQS